MALCNRRRDTHPSRQSARPVSVLKTWHSSTWRRGRRALHHAHFSGRLLVQYSVLNVRCTRNRRQGGGDSANVAWWPPLVWWPGGLVGWWPGGLGFPRRAHASPCSLAPDRGRQGRQCRYLPKHRQAIDRDAGSLRSLLKNHGHHEHPPWI